MYQIIFYAEQGTFVCIDILAALRVYVWKSRALQERIRKRRARVRPGNRTFESSVFANFAATWIEARHLVKSCVRSRYSKVTTNEFVDRRSYMS